VAIASALHTLVADSDQGEVFVDRARVVSRFPPLSVEPDAVVVLWDSLRSGRVRYVPSSKKQPDRCTEIEGAPDVIIGVVSDGSVRKDTQRLPPLYARAGIPELWLVDTRKEPLRFDIHLLQEGRYVRVEPDAEGWSRSERLSRSFRLTRRKTPVGTWGYRLEWRAGRGGPAALHNPLRRSGRPRTSAPCRKRAAVILDCVSFPPNSPHFTSQFCCRPVGSGRIPRASSTCPLLTPRILVNLRRLAG
jgi:Uma2 family endonuclease